MWYLLKCRCGCGATIAAINEIVWHNDRLDSKLSRLGYKVVAGTTEDAVESLSPCEKFKPEEDVKQEGKKRGNRNRA